MFESFVAPALPRPPRTTKALLIIRLDAIGDYVLFRNFLHSVRASKTYAGYRITLCGNFVWKDLAEYLDEKYVDEFIWVDRNKFRNSILYRYGIVAKIKAVGYETLIHPVYSRDFFWGDLITRLTAIPKRVTMRGDKINMTMEQHAISLGYYTDIIDDPNQVRFEFDRNKFFFAKLLNETISEDLPSIAIKEPRTNSPDYIVLFPGASQAWKRWPPENFGSIARILLERTNLHIYICGDARDLILANQITACCATTDRMKILCGKTSLEDLVKVLKNAKLLLSNDTSAVHLAAAVGGPRILAIFCGNHYGRFLPYPRPRANNFRCVMPPEMKQLSEKEKTNQFYADARGKSIHAITTESVWREIVKLL